MSLLSDEVNFLVYRYLQESGYQHSAFSFALESHISQSNINGNLVPSGALIDIIQKGIQFIEGELCINDDGSLIENLNALESLPLIDAVIPEVLAERAETLYRLVAQKQAKQALSPAKQQCKNNQVTENNENVIVLHGHKSEVFSCCWHPSCRILATGSADGVVGLWHLESNNEIKMIELKHNNYMNKKYGSTDITCLVWHPDGHALATAGSDFNMRIWDVKGKQITVLSDHNDLVLSLNWNKKGTVLLSAGLDRRCILWDERFQKLIEFSFHTGPIIDTDWQSDDTFASCSTDKSICLFNMEDVKPIKVFHGHTDVINCVKWDPTSTTLASCADDISIKLWDVKQDKAIANFLGHTKEVTIIKWASSKLLGSASYDHSVRIWDVENKTCLFTFNRHREPVNSISFEPTGRFIASAALDGLINIWDLQKGECIVSQHNTSGIFEVQWSSDSLTISICLTDKTVKLLDTRSLLPS